MYVSIHSQLKRAFLEVEVMAQYDRLLLTLKKSKEKRNRRVPNTRRWTF